MNTNRTGNEQLHLLQQLVCKAEPRAGITMLVFWKNLFELNPALRPLLGDKPGDEDYSVAHFLAAGLGPLFRQGMNSSPADGSEQRVSDNADEEQSSVLGEALLWSLEEAFGADFTPKVRSAWETLYRFVTMSNKQACSMAECPDFDTTVAAA